MTRGKRKGLLIAGGGLSASLAALAIATARPDIPVLLIGEEDRLGGDHDHWLFDDELSEEERTFIEPHISYSWPGFYVAFPEASRKLKGASAFIRGKRIGEAVRAALGEAGCRTNARIVAVRDDTILLQGGEKIVADAALDARDPTNLSMLELGWRHQSARDAIFEAPHRVDRPVLADATVDQSSGCRFVTCLPFGAETLRIEDVKLTSIPTYDRQAAEERIEQYIAERGWRGGETINSEAISAPLALGGDFAAFWRFGGARVAKLGPRGGFFHPATGSPIADAVRNALLLTRQREMHGAALHDLFEAHAASLWARRIFYRTVNHLLLARGRPALARLYALDAAIIARFHSERLGLLDRRRIQSAISG